MKVWIHIGIVMEQAMEMVIKNKLKETWIKDYALIGRSDGFELLNNEH